MERPPPGIFALKRTTAQAYGRYWPRANTIPWLLALANWSLCRFADPGNGETISRAEFQLGTLAYCLADCLVIGAADEYNSCSNRL